MIEETDLGNGRRMISDMAGESVCAMPECGDVPNWYVIEIQPDNTFTTLLVCSSDRPALIATSLLMGTLIELGIYRDDEHMKVRSEDCAVYMSEHSPRE